MGVNDKRLRYTYRVFAINHDDIDPIVSGDESMSFDVSLADAMQQYPEETQFEVYLEIEKETT